MKKTKSPQKSVAKKTALPKTKHYLVLGGYGTVGKYVVKDMFTFDKNAHITI